MLKLEEFVRDLDQTKYGVIKINKEGHIHENGHINYFITSPLCIYLLAAMQFGLDELKVTDSTFFNFDDQSLYHLVNSVKGFSPNGKFHRILNLANKICNQELLIDNGVYVQSLNLLKLANPKLAVSAELNNLLRCLSIKFSILDVSKIISSVIFNTFNLPQNLIALMLNNFKTIRLNNDMYYTINNLDLGVIMNLNEVTVIYQPHVSFTGSLKQEESIYLKTIKEK